VINLGEEPLFFPHAAARFAGEAGMPSRFLSFHNGHASLFEYYHGPDRKVYTDPRLEVAGAELFTRYVQLERRLQRDEPGWDLELAEMGRPVILVDHEYNATIGATLLGSSHWRCVWFDPTHTPMSSTTMPSISRLAISVRALLPTPRPPSPSASLWPTRFAAI
jgi:hypothetical protein